MSSLRVFAVLGFSVCIVSAASLVAQKPTISLDEFMNTTEITGTSLAPDASAAVIATEAPDWKANNFRHDLWMWTEKAGLSPLTRSGTDERPQWSPDGKWIAFTSDRSPSGDSGESDTDKPNRVWLISPSGGEALPLYREKLDVHAFAWAPDGSAIYVSAKAPQTHEDEDRQSDEWKDVVRWREQYRGDLLLKISIAPALARAVAMPLAKEIPGKAAGDAEPSAKLPEGASMIAKADVSIAEIAPAPDGKQIAFLTEPIHKRIENPADYEVFLVGGDGGTPKQLTHNTAMESHLRWSRDGHWIHFAVNAANGSIEGKYRDVQGRLFRMDASSGKIERLGSSFDGSFDLFTLLPDGRELALGLK